MADKDDGSLIGYDPLAWLQASQDELASDSAIAAEEPVIDVVVEEDSLPEAPLLEAIEDIQLDTDESVFDCAHESEDKTVVVLDSVLNIQNVSQLHQRLLGLLNDNSVIDIDASAVSMIDTASLQLLLVLKQTAGSLQKNVTIDFPSDRFMEAAELLGVTELLGVDQPASGFF